MKDEQIRLIINKATTARQEDMLYAARFLANEAKAQDGVILTARWTPFWVTDDGCGWVPATSHPVSKEDGVDSVPRDVKVWSTREEAEKFMRHWHGHPWYCRPLSWEVVQVVRNFRFVFSHYSML